MIAPDAVRGRPEAGPTVGAAASSRRSEAGRRWPHVIAAFVVLVTMNLIAGDRGFFSADEVVVHEQVEQLADGAWIVESTDPVLVQDPARHPLEGVLRSELGYAPYAKHALFPLLLVPGDALLGRMGRFATVAAFAVAGAAVLASVASRRRTPWPVAFWMVALGTTLPFHAGVLWAHAPAFAAVALAMSPLERAASGESLRRRDLAALAAATVASGWLRSEATIFFVALGMVALTLGTVHRRLGLALLGTAASTSAVLAFWAEGLLRAAIVGSSGGGTLSVPSTATFDIEARRFLVELWVFGFNGRLWSLLPFVATAVLAIETTRVSRGASARLPLLVAAVGCTAFGVLDGPSMSVVATVPLLVVGVIAALGAFRDDVFAQLALGGSAVYFAAVVMTSYASAGGGDWGGRYLFVMVAPLGVVAASGLRDLWRTDRFVPAAAAAAAMCMAVAMMADVVSHRQNVANLADGLLNDVAAARAVIDLDETRSDAPFPTVVTDPRISRLLVEEGIGGAVYLARDETALTDLLLALERDSRRCVVYVDTLQPLTVDTAAATMVGAVRVSSVSAAEFVPLEQAFCSDGR